MFCLQQKKTKVIMADRKFNHAERAQSKYGQRRLPELV